MEAKETGTLSDQEVIERVLSGEKNLYEKLIRKYNQRMYRICMSVVGDDTEAEDIMQNAYISAYRHLGSFQNRASFSTWLTRIMINECFQWTKKQSKHAAGEPEEGTHYNTPLKQVMNKELKDILEKAVAQLPEKYRLVFVMREVEDMDVRETMEVLDLTESNVKVRLNRAKEMLRNNLSAYLNPKEIYDFNLVRCDRIVNGVMKGIEVGV